MYVFPFTDHTKLSQADIVSSDKEPDIIVKFKETTLSQPFAVCNVKVAVLLFEL